MTFEQSDKIKSLGHVKIKSVVRERNRYYQRVQLAFDRNRRTVQKQESELNPDPKQK